MLRRIAQKKSLQLWLHEFTGQPLSGSSIGLPAMQLTCLRNFSAPTEAGTPTEDSTTSTNATEKSEPKQRGKGPASAPPGIDGAAQPTSTAMLQNAKLWRQWVDGRIDERHRTPTYSPSDAAQQARQGSGAAGAGGGRPPQQQKYRPKDPAKDWKHASRSLRSSQDRIASILVQDSDKDPRKPYSGKYGVLGTASDAPRHVPGAAAKAEETSPERLLPHRLFYPGATYAPEDLDPYKAKPVGLLSDLTVRRGSIAPRVVAANGDFRNPMFLNSFISDAGKLMPRRRTRLPAKMHRELARQVKLSRQLALMNPIAKVRPMRRGQRETVLQAEQ